MPRPSKLARGHHAAMAYEDVAAFVGKLRGREATAALALEFCILTERFRKSAQFDKWSFCLTAGKIVPRIRRLK